MNVAETPGDTVGKAFSGPGQSSSLAELKCWVWRMDGRVQEQSPHSQIQRRPKMLKFH